MRRGAALLLAPLLLAAAPAQALTATDNQRGAPRDGGDDQFSPGYIELEGDRVFDAPRGPGAPFDFGTETVNGIEVTGRLDFMGVNGTTTSDTKDPGETDYIYARTFLSLTNPGPAASLTLEFAVHTGGGFNGHIAAEGAGWRVMDDNDDGGPATRSGATNDPAVGIAWSNGLGAVAPDVSSDAEAKEWTFIELDLDFTAGETLGVLVYLASRNETDSFGQTASTAQSQADILALLADPELMFGGMSEDEIASVVNFGLLPTPLPGGLGLLALGLGGLAALRRRG